MKNLILLTLGISLLIVTFFLPACKKPDTPAIPDDEKEAYYQVINLQDGVSSKLDDWFTSIDSLAAINMAQQEFANDPGVSSAIISSQGISVQYKNGMRGGLFLNPRDGGELSKNLNSTLDLLPNDSKELKSIVNKRKMLIINPHYYERSEYTNFLTDHEPSLLREVGMNLFLTTNTAATVEAFTKLSDYGIVQIYSHGYAWPKEENITDIYVLTGETVNEATSNTYWDELKSGNIPIMKIGNNNNKYFISERFIAEHNDFSQDTVLFYGGFCYSFLGDWPDIIESFADGAYLGFDWSVRTDYNTDWSYNMISLLTDTSKTEPIGIEAWMQDPTMEKSYFDASDNRTVHIYYTGDGNLKLWDDITVKIEPLSTDGTPVDNPGEVGISYPFKCQLTGSSAEVEYIWDIGDGSSAITTQNNEVEITWSSNGEYELSVTVKDKSNNQEIGNAVVAVSIGENLPTWNSVEFHLRHLSAYFKHVVLPDGTTTYFDSEVDWMRDNFDHPGIYQDGSFTSTWDINDGTWRNTGSVLLTVNEQTKEITGSIHSEFINLSTPDTRYYVIDFDITGVSSTIWESDNASFLLPADQVGNSYYLSNLSYEDSQPNGVFIYINTMQSYESNSSSYFDLNLSTK